MRVHRAIKKHHPIPRQVLLVLLVGLMAACSVRDGPPDAWDVHWRDIPDAVPRDEPPSKYGNPASYEVFGERYYVLKSSDGFSEQGVASWYGTKFHGQRTSSGETYDMYAMTAAHKSLPLPCYVEVTNLNNNRKAVVKVNDRGPFHDNRIIDLSYAAATKLGIAASGVAPVKIRVVNGNTIDTDETPEQGGVIAGSIDSGLTDDNGRLYVQVAAFNTEENALKMLDELRAQAFSGARIHVENHQDGLLYRVRIGPVPTVHVAKKLVAQLQELKYKNLKTVTYN